MDGFLLKKKFFPIPKAILIRKITIFSKKEFFRSLLEANFLFFSHMGFFFVFKHHVPMYVPEYFYFFPQWVFVFYLRFMPLYVLYINITFPSVQEEVFRFTTEERRNTKNPNFTFSY